VQLDLLRDTAKAFPSVDDPKKIRSLRVWHCKYKSLDAIGEMRNLEELVVAGFPDESLGVLEGLLHLRYVSILHLPKVSDLTPFRGLDLLESLSLATSANWDAPGKKTVVKSLAPLAAMKSLKYLELFGVCPEERSLAALEACKVLVSGRFSQYPAKEIARFYSVMKIADAFNPKPNSQFGNH